jgi:hypothetical protein
MVTARLLWASTLTTELAELAEAAFHFSFRAFSAIGGESERSERGRSVD